MFPLSNKQQMSYLSENTNSHNAREPGETREVGYRETTWQGEPMLVDRKWLEESLQQQVKRERLIREITQQIRQSLNVQEVLEIAVAQVRQFLECDRVFIYRFEPDWSGMAIAESVAAGWEPILGKILTDPCFVQTYVQPYIKGRIQATADIYPSSVTLGRGEVKVIPKID
jgi:GAF domain